MSKRFNDVCRKVGSEGTVLLKNDENVLPIAKGTVVSVFGRMQNHYIKSGLGSGGLVNVEYVVDIPEGLGNADRYAVSGVFVLPARIDNRCLWRWRWQGLGGTETWYADGCRCGYRNSRPTNRPPDK